MIEIEFNKPNLVKCECCENESVNLTRFVSKDGNAYAIYYANFTFGHDDKVVNGMIGLGDWGEFSNPENRTAFPFCIWEDEDIYQISLVDRIESPWSDVTF